MDSFTPSQYHEIEQMLSHAGVKNSVAQLNQMIHRHSPEITLYQGVKKGLMVHYMMHTFDASVPLVTLDTLTPSAISTAAAGLMMRNTDGELLNETERHACLLTIFVRQQVTLNALLNDLLSLDVNAPTSQYCELDLKLNRVAMANYNIVNYINKLPHGEHAACTEDLREIHQKYNTGSRFKDLALALHNVIMGEPGFRYLNKEATSHAIGCYITALETTAFQSKKASVHKREA